MAAVSDKAQEELRAAVATVHKDAADARRDAAKALQKVTTLGRHVGFVWTATMTNGCFGHVSRVVNQTRLLFVSRVAAVVGGDFAPVKGDPGTRGSWEKGKVLVPLRPDAALGAAAAPPQLLRLFERLVTMHDGESDTVEQPRGVFGFCLVRGNVTDAKAALQDHSKARDRRKHDDRLPDPDASSASQPLLRGLKIAEPVTEEFASGFALAGQAMFLTCAGKQQHRFAHGDDGMGMRWESGDADDFAHGVLEKIQELCDVADRLEGPPVEGAEPVAGSVTGGGRAAGRSKPPPKPSLRVCVAEAADGSWDAIPDADLRSIEDIAALLEWAEYAVSFLLGVLAARASASAAGRASASAAAGDS